LTVAVRQLCDFAARAGDLDLRFTPTPSAQEGIAGHRQVLLTRPAHYRREMALESTCHGLLIRGRVDGFDPKAARIEEIKTHRGDVERIKGNQRALHWAQAKVYGALLCRLEGRAEIELALVYFNLDSESETVLVEQHQASDLWVFLETLVERYQAWARAEALHRAKRDVCCQSLQFPYASFRSGQRKVAEAVFRGAVHQRQVLINAPTGIGKSVATLFPIIKAMEKEKLDKVFFLTAKGSGKKSARHAIESLGLMKKQGALRTLELTARDKACLYPAAACHGESCPLARGFYDRLPAARLEAQREAIWNADRLRELAGAHSVCPYFLSQELSRWADVVIADYNYYFDQSALLWAQTVQNEWRVALLVDEAHNLVDRGREMYSARLQVAQLYTLERQGSKELLRVSKRFRAAWRKAALEQRVDVLAGLPEKLGRALDSLVRVVGEEMGQRAAELPAPALEPYFHVLQFARLTESMGDHSVLYFSADGDTHPALVLQNCVPARFLAERARHAHTSVYFSATLSPFHYYRNLLGLPDDAVDIEVESPFAMHQLQVHVAPHVSTRHASRRASIAPIVAMMRAQYMRRPANYLAFFSSYAYLNDVFDAFLESAPELPLWRQERSMSDATRAAFIERFTETSRGVGFAVLGGSFSEGIDLPGSRLFGAFVVTLGLPQVNQTNDILRKRLHQMFGAGFEYAYLYPGLRKVAQAAGRVIRTTSDQGVIHLIDHRFSEKRVRDLLPSWWPAPIAVSDLTEDTDQLLRGN
jgi:Rad3-related DNA helicase